MSDDRHRRDEYLWRREGPVDDEVRALEALLSPLRHRHDPHFLRRLPPGTETASDGSGMHDPAASVHEADVAGLSPPPPLAGGGASPSTSTVDPAHAPAPSAGPSSLWRWVPLVAAALLVVWIVLPREPAPPAATGPRAGQAPDAVADAPTPLTPREPAPVADERPPDRVAPYEVDGIEGLERVRAGSHFVADPWRDAVLALGPVGAVRLDAGSYASVVHTGDPTHRLALHTGRLQAKVGGAPGRLEIETPGGLVTSLGGALTVGIEALEGTRLRVDHGAAWLAGAGRRVYVPAGASARAWPGLGPTAPVRDEFDETIAAEITTLHAELLARRAETARDGPAAGGEGEDKPPWGRWPLEEMLAGLEGPEHTITRFYLLDALADLDAALGTDHRTATIRRMVETLPPPPPITVERLVAGDAKTLATWEDWLRETVWAP